MGRTGRAARRCLVAVVLLVSCVDGPAAPGHFGELRFRPIYVAGDEPSSLGVAIDSAAVRVTRPAEPGAAMIDTTVAYRTDTASFAWILELQAESESLRVDVSVWSGGKRFYDGGERILVSDGAPAAAVTEPVDVVYVGPPIVATLTVSPTSVTLEAIDATHGLAAEARGRDGAVIPDAAIAWASDNEAVVRVDPSSGVITAIANGTAMVSASSGNSRGDAAVVVQQRVSEIAVNPPAFTLTGLGATLTLVGEARDANGHAVVGAELSWASDAPQVAGVDPTTGRVTAVAGGSATITATSAGVTGTAVVTVNPIADVATIDVSPSVATLTARDATRQYTAVARDAGGNVLDGVQFTWASSVVNVATIDAASGLARAVGHGATTVTASAGAAVGTASLTVDLSSTIVSVHVSPATAKLETRGATQQFTAVALDAGGSVVPVASFDWTSAQPSVATVDGTTGLATAVGHGTAPIRATIAGVTGEATLTVDLTVTVATVHVSPGAATLTSLDATQQFTAEALDAGGQVVLGVPFAWSSSAPTVGEIDPATGIATAKGHGVTTITATTGAVTGTATLTVDLETVVASVVVSPATATLTAVGATQLFTAVARDAQGTVLPGVLFTWTSSVLTVATIDADGLASAVRHGTTVITATAGSTAGTASLTVDFGETIATVLVSPATAELQARGATQQFVAEARNASGTIVPVAAFTWTSTQPTVATVDATTGLATAVGHGTTAIRATVAGVTGEASLTVDLTPTVASVHVSPPIATLSSLGATQQFTAEARDAAGKVVLGVPFVWISSASAVATVDPNGLATATGHGVTTITATTGTVTGSASLTVDLEPGVASVVVSPATATLNAVEATQLFTGVARDAQGTVLPGVPFTWTSSVPSVATVNATGLATATGHGTTAIRATVAGVTGEAILTVDLTPTVASVHVSPPIATLSSFGATQQFTAEARDAGGQVVHGVPLVWISSAPAVATIDPIGLATATGHGVTTITATTGTVSGSASLTVDLEPVVATVVVSPATATLTAVDATQLFTAVARDAQGTVLPGVSVTWTSSVPAVATIAVDGRASAVSHGTTVITATAGSRVGTATLTVDFGETIATVRVLPATAELEARGATQQFTAEARNASGGVVPVSAFTWTSSVPSVATVDATTGLATAVGHGITAIRATVAGVTGEATLTVDLTPTVASVHVSPPTATLSSLGATQQFTAEARDASGQVVLGVPFVWISSAPTVGEIDPTSGRATATGHGVTTITATIGTVSGSASLTVDLEPVVATVVVSPATATLTAVDATQLFTAVARDAQGTVLPGVLFTWTSSVPAVATIAADGRASAVRHGTTVITATAGSTAGTATFTVDLGETIATVHVSPATAELESRGATQQFVAEARNASGGVVPVAAFTWTSTQPAVATVDGTGLATAAGHGITAIRATVEGVTGEASLTVDLTPTVASVHVSPPTATLSSLGATQQFTAEARDAGGQLVTGVPFTWSSSTPTVGEIDPATGLATATGDGSATITATTGTVAGNAALSVNLITSVASVDVSPAEATLRTIGAVQQFTAIARDASGTPLPGVSFAWSSSIETVASVDATGRAAAAGHGMTSVTASVNGISDFATLTVDLSTTIATIEVSPASATLTSLGATQQFTAVARDANGAMVPVNDFAWSSSAPEIATVGSTGLATARRHGLTTIAAVAGGKAGSASLSVDLRDAIAQIVVTPAAATLEALGVTQAFQAEARDAAGGVISGVTFVWTSSQATVASIDPGTGVATAVANGTATITATAGTVSGMATLTVQQRVASVVVTPTTATLRETNRTQQFSAQALDANGRVVAGVTFTWLSSNTAVATVNANGLATSRGFGIAQIRATTAGITGTAVLTVQDDD